MSKFAIGLIFIIERAVFWKALAIRKFCATTLRASGKTAVFTINWLEKEHICKRSSIRQYITKRPFYRSTRIYEHFELFRQSNSKLAID
ncbi:hypothetical protein AcW1_004128 [Taiwanofungus camphoratus]|nr:hypothetical protein AcW1_004128 [Antrodia cinnamomea]